MSNRIKTPENTILVPSEIEGGSGIERTHEVRIDFNPEGMSEGLLPLKAAQVSRAEADERMLRQEAPKTHSEIYHDYATGLSSNTIALRQGALQAALEKERNFYGSNYELINNQDDVRLAS